MANTSPTYDPVEAAKDRRAQLIYALLGAGGAAMESAANYSSQKAARRQQERLSRSQTLTDIYSRNAAEDFAREKLALEAHQQNPFSQLEFDQGQAVRAALLRDISNVTGSFDPGSGTGRLVGGVNLANLQDPLVQKFFSEPARLAARTEFDMIRASAAPNVPIGTMSTSSTGSPLQSGLRSHDGPATGTAIPRGSAGVSSSGTPIGSYVGYGEAGTDAARAVGQFGQARYADLVNRRDVEREAVMRALADDVKGEKKKKGSSFWKKLAKVGLVAGAGVATAMTGGAAAPLIGAAAGAGSGALDGGWKGALMGAGLGAATGGLGGGAASGVKAGVGSALKSTLTNPQMLARMGGAAIGGPAGDIIQAGAGFLPGTRPVVAAPAPRTALTFPTRDPYRNLFKR